jgi:hypothetical protein
MLHKPAAPVEEDSSSAYKTRLGVWMFLFYALYYAGFVIINLTSPQAMGTVILLGLNLATVYGMSLILVALLEALVYTALCSRAESRHSGKGS